MISSGPISKGTETGQARCFSFILSYNYIETVHLFNSHGTGVTGQNIPPAGVYPGIVWPRPLYTRGILWPRPIHTPSGHNILRCINCSRPQYTLAWTALTPGIIRAASN